MIGVLERNGPPLSEDPLINSERRHSFHKRLTNGSNSQQSKYDVPLEALRQRSLRTLSARPLKDMEWPEPLSVDPLHRPSFRRKVSENELSLYSMYETPSEKIAPQRRSVRTFPSDAPLRDMELPEAQSEDHLMTPPRRPSLLRRVSNKESSPLHSEDEMPSERMNSLKDMDVAETLSDDSPILPQRRPSLQKRVSSNESSRSKAGERSTPRRRSLSSHRSRAGERITPRRRSLNSPLLDMEWPETPADDTIMTPPRRPSLQRGGSSNESSFHTKYETPPERITPRRRSLRLARPLDTPLKDAEWAKPEPVTTLYRHAKEQAWEAVAVDCKIHKDEASYVYPMDGTTALHLAVMSRVGYSFESEEKVKHPAPLSVVEELLQVYPDAAKVPCQVNTYTPLAYACLVSGSDCCLEETDEMVRLFLQYSPESTSMYTSGGLSAVDVHIVSYSRVMGGRKNEGTHLSGRTSTVVLRTLLEFDPTLANTRISNDKLGGPIEILYRCNSRAFMKLVSEYETKRKEREKNRIMTTAETEDKNKQVLARISKWWVWQWIVVILKYDTLPKKKKGARFFALQAASGLVGCPLPILTLAMAAFPNQVKEKDEMHGTDGNLPLHEVCSWPQESTLAIPVIATRKGMAITALVQRYPNAVFACNARGESPLDLALSTGTTWDGGIRKLVRTYPASASTRNSATGLYPFMTAAAVAAAGSAEQNGRDSPLVSSKRSLMTRLKNEAKRDLQTVRTIYGLLRADPDVMMADEDDSDDDDDDDSLSAIEQAGSFEDDDECGIVSSDELEWSGLLSTAQSIREESHRWANLAAPGPQRWAELGDVSFRTSVRDLNYRPDEDDMSEHEVKRTGYF